MARIVHASNFSRKAKGAFQHSVEHKINNGLIRNGHAVSTFSDREVARASTWLGHRAFAGRATNRAFIEFCHGVEPDLIVLGHADTITPETLAGLRRTLSGVRILQYNVDPVTEAPNVAVLKSKIEFVDATLISSAGEALRQFYRSDRLLGFLPNPVDFSIEVGRCHERSTLPFDLFYACGNENSIRHLCGIATTGKDVLAKIEVAVPNLRLRTPGARGEPNLRGGKYQRALESAAIGLNISKYNDVYLYSSDRIAQLTGNGMAVLIDRATGYQDLFGEGEFVYFRDFDEMIEKLRRLIAEPDYRQRVAAAGRSRYHELFNEQVVARYLVDVAFDRLDPAAYPWPTLHAF